MLNKKEEERLYTNIGRMAQEIASFRGRVQGALDALEYLHACAPYAWIEEELEKVMTELRGHNDEG